MDVPSCSSKIDEKISEVLLQQIHISIQGASENASAGISTW